MDSVIEVVVSKDKNKKASKAAHSEPQPAQVLKRKDLYQQHQLFRDLAGWLTEIADYETKVRRRRGELKGRESITVAKLVDPELRNWAWTRLRKIRNAEAGTPDAAIPPAPPQPVEEFESE